MNLVEERTVLGTILHGLGVLVGAAGMTACVFFLLPLIQSIAATEIAGSPPPSKVGFVLPPPPPAPENEPPPEEEAEPEPPQLVEDTPLLDLSQLELALNPGFGMGSGAGYDLSLNKLTAAAASSMDELFSLGELDQQPRPVYQPGPSITDLLRRKAPGTVYVVFVVDKRGKVKDATVQSSSDPIFENPAMAAVRKWRFEPGQRKGEPVSFRMRVPITFPR